ncbi:MAG: alpha/beta fold hydrolase [Flavisolibacter sp.]|nr:alpha/beta fold hydrolase [Flavisolibacter sp.]
MVPNSYSQNAVEGFWKGHIAETNSSLELRFNVFKNQKGLSANFNIPQSAIYMFPLNVTFDSAHIELVLPGFILFKGEVQNDAMKGKVSFQNRQYDFIVARTMVEKAAYKEEEVRFHNGNIVLSGTLRLPLSTGRHAAIFLLQGSGATDRMGESFYADFFARQGIATLVYDKRGTGKSSGNWETASFKDFASDALAGIHYLQSRAEIDSKKVGLWGRSHGGMVAPLAASLSKDVAFIINVSGNALPVTENIIYGVKSNMIASGFPVADTAEAADYLRQKYAVAKTGKGWEQLQERITSLRNENANWLPQYAGIPKSLETLQYFWKTQFYYDPSVYWQKLKIPVLAVYGEKDPSQPVKEISSALRTALKRNKNFSLKIFANADHALLVWSGSEKAPHFPVLAEGFLDTLKYWTNGVTSALIKAKE